MPQIVGPANGNHVDFRLSLAHAAVWDNPSYFWVGSQVCQIEIK